MIPLHMGNEFRVPHGSSETPPVRVGSTGFPWGTVMVKNGDATVLKPGKIVGVQVREYITVPYDCVGMVHGVYSLSELGVVVLSQLLQPGFSGHPSVTLIHSGPAPVYLEPGMEVCAVAFLRHVGCKIEESHVGGEVPDESQSRPFGGGDLQVPESGRLRGQKGIPRGGGA
jgi:hypothetical protein